MELWGGGSAQRNEKSPLRGQVGCAPGHHFPPIFQVVDWLIRIASVLILRQSRCRRESERLGGWWWPVL